MKIFLRKVFENKFNIIFLLILILIFCAFGFLYFFPRIQLNEEYVEPYVAETTVKSTTEKSIEKPTEVGFHEEIATVVTSTKAVGEKETTTEATEESLPYATFATEETTASYQSQWDAGYLIALDYPDKNYSCPHVELSEENRDLIERVCLGEFGAGGFNGMALIAQSIKNAMVHYNTDNVESIIGKLRFSGRKTSSSTKTAQDAVVYIFDMDKDAVQHRILYKYNPDLTDGPSEFHESKTYVCTYNNVRFFDE